MCIFCLIISLLIGVYILYGYLRHNGLLPKKSVKNQHIFITGAGSGIGFQMAKRFAQLGAKISLVDIDMNSIEKAVEQFKNEGFTNCVAIQCDISKKDQIKQAFQQARDKFQKIDILINNAGIVSGKKIYDVSDEMIQKTIDINLTAHFFTTKEALNDMIQTDLGHIVTIASMAGVVGSPGLVDYCASKSGAIGFDESLRMELKKKKSNVQTTCICPYFIQTGMFEGVQGRYSFVLPILSVDYATTRIVNAILQNERFVMMPYFCYVSYILKGLLPIYLYDFINDFFGTFNAMDHFVGKKKKE